MSWGTPTGEHMDLGDLPAAWSVVERLYDEVEGLPPPLLLRALTIRAFDEAKPAGPRTYMAVQRYLGVAMDNHFALRHLLERYAVTPSAPWSLLRPTFEAAFRALWIIDPPSSEGRRLRGLQSEVNDALEGDRHLRVFEKVPGMEQKVRDALGRREDGPERVFREEAALLEVTWQTAKRKINLVDDLPRLGPVGANGDGDFMGPWLVGQWRMMSGYEHGLAWAMMRGSDSVPKVKIPGGQEMFMTINDEAFVAAGKAAMFLLANALRRLRHLHTTSA